MMMIDERHLERACRDIMRLPPALVLLAVLPCSWALRLLPPAASAVRRTSTVHMHEGPQEDLREKLLESLLAYAEAVSGAAARKTVFSALGAAAIGAAVGASASDASLEPPVVPRSPAVVETVVLMPTEITVNTADVTDFAEATD